MVNILSYTFFIKTMNYVDFIGLQLNGCVYETLGIAGFVPIRRHKRRYGAEILNQLLKNQCFIHDVLRIIVFQS